MFPKFWPHAHHIEQWHSLKFHCQIQHTDGETASKGHLHTTWESNQYQYHHHHYQSHLINPSITCLEILLTSLSNRSWLSPKFHGSTLLSHGETALNRHLPQNDLATSTSNTSIINDHISSTTASIISKFYPLIYHNKRWLSFKCHGLIPQTHGDMAFNSHPGTTSPCHQCQHHHPHLKSHLLNHSINLSEILPTSIS